MYGPILKRFGCFHVRDTTDKGLSCFASCVIEADTDVIEYLGKRILMKDSANVDYNHAIKGKSMTVASIYSASPQFVIDGAVDENGVEFGVFDNPAVLLNHDRDFPNCRLRRHHQGMLRMKLYLRTTRRILKGEELLYEYGDFAANDPFLQAKMN